MSSKSGNSTRLEDLILMEDDTLESSISLSVGENSGRILGKEKSEVSKPNDLNTAEKWWLKRPETRIEITSVKSVERKMRQSPSPSPDVSSSMKEFLEKEKMCKALHRNEDVKDKDDTLCDILASVAFEKYPSDFENATDDDIGSILEEMSKIAGALSPNSVAEHTKPRSLSKNTTEEEKSVEELLEEAEKLVRKNSSTLLKNASKSDTLAQDNPEDKKNLNKVRQLEAEIFQLIEEEVHKESEKIRKSPKNEKKQAAGPALEIVYESLNGLRPPKTLEFQRRKFEEQKVEVSSSSDLDDPIEKHSKSEELKSKGKLDEKKDSLQKEITDVDKDFFEDLLKRSKDKAEGGMSGSSSFGQEDFSHFLKLLQGQTEGKQETSDYDPMFNFLSQGNNTEIGDAGVGCESIPDKSPEFPEKEICEILEKELSSHKEFSRQNRTHNNHEITETDSSEEHQLSRNMHEVGTSTVTEKSTEYDFTTNEESSQHKDLGSIKKVVNSKNELYTIGLTPRLELFADAIPKLMAEKELPKNEVKEDHKNDKSIKPVRTGTTDKNSTADISTLVSETFKVNKVVSAQQKKGIRFCKSKSYDQICKSVRPVSESVRTVKSVDITKKLADVISRHSPPLKPKVQKQIAKIPLKAKLSSKFKQDAAKMGSTLSLPAVYKSQVKSADVSKNVAGGNTKQNLTKRDWEILCQEERQRNTLLKQQLESEAKLYKTQIDNMRTSFEEELFVLKKQNIILKAKIDELSLNEKRQEIHFKPDSKALLLEKELERQENLIQAYETENKKLMIDIKRLQEELKNVEQKQKNTILEGNETQRLADRVKDLEEETLKLNLEISEWRQRNADSALKNEDLIQQNGLLNDELEMFKEQLRTKNNFITDRLQAMTCAEHELKKQVEELTVKLNSKSEQLRIVKSEFDKLQQNILPLEKELLVLRIKEGNLQEKLQVSKSHVEREKQLTQKLKDQVILDNKKIMDLNRQVREMERILKRKNPDSVSALILTANSEQEKIGSEKVKLLEERIISLENEIKTKEEISQQKLSDFQRKFNSMKEKYSAQIVDLEGKLLEATVKDHKTCNDMFTQTMSKHVENKGVETIKKEEKAKAVLKSQNPKEDAHLIATIRGLKLELTNKDKTVLKLTKELQELQKTNRKLQKEREKLLNDRKIFKNMDLERSSRFVPIDSRLFNSKTSEGNDQNSNVYQNGHTIDSNSQRSGSTQKLYDPMQYTETNENGAVKKLTEENEILKEELNKINKDFMVLKNKRLHDLNLLQEEHEREMATLVKEYSIKFGDSKVVKLQGQINTQVAVISHLKQQIEKFRDYKEQVTLLKTERDYLENKVKSLNEKIKYLSTPGTEQLQLLQDKITILQQRHETREMTLQNLVRDLLRNRTQCKECKNEMGKNKQLCYFRQELDHILGMLQEITNVH